MKTYTFEGKTKEAAVELALEELKISEEDLIINNITEKIMFQLDKKNPWLIFIKVIRSRIILFYHE